MRGIIMSGWCQRGWPVAVRAVGRVTPTSTWKQRVRIRQGHRPRILMRTTSAMASPQSLGNVLQEIIDRMGMREQIDGVHAVETWAHIAGAQINGNTERVWANERKLYVQVRSSAWRQQLHLQRRDWLQRLNKELGKDVIDEIIFR